MPDLSQPTHFFVGIDPAAETFTASLLCQPDDPATTENFPNTLDGFDAFLTWLGEHDVVLQKCLVCVEATGIYAEALCYFLVEQAVIVAVEAPLKVKRAFKTSANKNDPTDSRQIAEYAFRFLDELRLWQPKEATIEQIRVLLTAREQFVSQVGATRNMRHVLQRKVVQTPAANTALDETLAYLKAQISAIEEEIKGLIRSDPTLSDLFTLLVSIPSVGLLLAAHMLVVTNGAQRQVTARQLAAYIGICPYEFKSGTSVERPSRSRGYGPPMLRKLMYLGAMNLKRSSARHRLYYEQKVAEGKAPRLVLNNLSNKLLRLICAVLRERCLYRESYRSVNPNLPTAA